MTEGRPQVPEGLGDTITSIGGTAADLIRYIYGFSLQIKEYKVISLKLIWP